MFHLVRRFSSTPPPTLLSTTPLKSILTTPQAIFNLQTPPPNNKEHMVIALDVSYTKVGIAHTVAFSSSLLDDSYLLTFPYKTVSRRTRHPSLEKWVYDDTLVFSTLKSLPSVVSHGDLSLSSSFRPTYVVGYPLSLDGSDNNPQCSTVLNFVKKGVDLGIFSLPAGENKDGDVCLWDERFSTNEAYGLAVDILLGGEELKNDYESEHGVDVELAGLFGGDDDDADTASDDDDDDDWGRGGGRRNTGKK